MNKIELMYAMRSKAMEELARCDAAVAAVSLCGDEPFVNMRSPDLVLGNILYWHDAAGKFLATMQVYDGAVNVTRYHRGPSQGSKFFTDCVLAIAWVRDHLESMSYLERAGDQAQEVA